MSPLSYPVKPKVKLLSKIGQTVQRLLGYLRPNIILTILLIVSIVLAFFKISAIGFYFICGIFIIGYFAERIIIRVCQKKIIKTVNKTEVSKN